MTEDRISNREHLKSLGLYEMIICVICQQVIMPKNDVPVYCTMCQNAVYCKSCIIQWQQRRRECCKCKQTKNQGQFHTSMDSPKFALAFKEAKIRCKNYPNCLEVVPLASIEKHEKLQCKFQPCKQCGRTLKHEKISMEAHLVLHCEESNIICQFCKITMTRRELLTTHKCDAVYPFEKYMIKREQVVNASIIQQNQRSLMFCFFCDNFLRKALRCQ